MEESDAKERAAEAPCEEHMDQGYKGGSDEDESDSTLNGSHSSASSHGSVHWADQCLSKDEGDHMSGDEEGSTCVTQKKMMGRSHQLHRPPRETNRDPRRSHWSQCRKTSRPSPIRAPNPPAARTT